MKRTLFFLSFLLSFTLAESQDYCSQAGTGEKLPGSFAPGYSPLECLYDVKFYFLDLEVSDTTAALGGSASIDIKMLGNTDTIAFELAATARVDSVFVDNIPVNSFIHDSGILKIFPVGFSSGSNHRIRIVYYAGTAEGSGLFTGVTQMKDPFSGVNVTWSLSEPFQAKDWFPCKQDLQDKADSVWVFLTVPPGRMAGSNGLLTRITDRSNGKKRYEWKSKYPIAYYLISFSVADYYDYSFYVNIEGADDSLLVQNFIYNTPGMLDSQKELIDKTAGMLQFFSEIYGTYPFSSEKYGHCMAPLGGGMEHQTMTTLQNFNFGLVAHELAHQWYGDNVTCASWRDIWMNEGFASYSEFLALEALESEESAYLWLESAHNIALNYPDHSIYLSEEEAEIDGRIFSYGLTYKKGASIIHMLRYEMNNDPLFFEILHDFQQEYADSVATAEDFLSMVNDQSGEDYTWFFDQWYYGKGYPVFQTTWKQTYDSLFFEVMQFSSSEEEFFFRSKMDYRIFFEDGTDTTVRINITQNLQSFSFDIGKNISSISADPEGHILMKHTVFKYFPDSVFYQLSPNPFIDNLRISFSDFRPETTIFVSDMNGRIVRKAKVSGKSASLDLHSLHPGIYLLVVINEDGRRYATRIIKMEEK